MFKLFSNIFEQSQSGQPELPKPLLKAAIERAVDGTDPRLRLLPGYARNLRGPVLHAADYVVGLARSLAPPAPVSREDFQRYPDLAAIFYSAERLERLTGQDAALREFVKSNGAGSDPVYALLAVHKKQKHVLGIALVDGETRKDVAQTTVSFDHHWFVDPSHGEEQTRRLLMRRIFDRLLAIALSRLLERQEERENLAAHRALLRCKLEVLERSGCLDNEPRPGEKAQLETRMVEIEQQMAAIGPNEGVLPANLATVAEVLAGAEHHLWIEPSLLSLDRYYVLHDESDPAVPQIPFEHFHDAQREGIVVRLVQIGPPLLPSLPRARF